MTALVAARMRDLAESLADLKVRLRDALAGELAQLVARAVGDVVRTLVAGQAGREPPPVRSWHEHDAWDDDFDPEEDFVEEAAPESPGSPAAAAAPIAIAAAVHAVRWWLGRSGTFAGAVGLGLGVGVLGLTGGAIVRCALAALTTAADLLAVTNALDAGAARLQPN
ncbi:MAG TPA: hypothetical protein VN641_08690 [Urbifossiella sp.]|nr:hypothetical protein [Urbifossiella sp.]